MMLQGYKKDRYRIGRVYVNITDPEKARRQVKEVVAKKQGGYIALSDVRSVSYANEHSDYCKVLNNSTFTFTDGMPLIWMARLWGIKENRRTAGPILFTSLLAEKDNGLKHFMLGDTEETLEALKSKYSDADIVGTFSPPFCEVDEFDYDVISKMLNASEANIVWVALHAPKQDYFSARLAPLLTDGKVCIDVGAAFRFALGQYKMPPKWVQSLGIIGIFWRKFSFNLIMWYIIESFHLVKWGIDILNCRLRGVKYFE